MQNEVGKQEMKTLPKILAVDFDGTLVEDEFPNIGQPIHENVMAVKRLQEHGVKVILYTCRDNDTVHRHLECAVVFCREVLKLEFDAVNRNIAETINMFNNDTRKVYADVYWDDKAIPHTHHPRDWHARLGVKEY